MLKKARLLRKQKMELIQKERMEAAEEARKQQQQFINRNMFEDDR